MEQANPEGTLGAGDSEIKLSKQEYDKLITDLASSNQATSSLRSEIIELRQKNRDQSSQSVVIEPEAIKAAVDEELKKREVAALQEQIQQSTNEFLTAHQEFSSENDPGGIKLAAYQKALARINLVGVKTKTDYDQVLDDAYSLMPKEVQANPTLSSTPRNGVSVPSTQASAHLSPAEQKLVADSFSGNVESYLAAKAKRPEYIATLLEWIR